MNTRAIVPSLRLSATLLLVGQLLYIVITQLHTGGDANDHPAIFAAYAGSGIWTAVHVGQFAAMAVLLAGLLAQFFALDLALAASAPLRRWPLWRCTAPSRRWTGSPTSRLTSRG